MKVHKFDTLYPRKLWIVNYDGDYRKLMSKYIFYLNLPGWTEINTNMEKELNDADRSAIAGCYVVEERNTGLLGIMLIIFDIYSVDTSIMAHESVHIADYYYEACGCNSEDFTDGNEAYAYMVGWAADCIANVLIKEKDGKTE